MDYYNYFTNIFYSNCKNMLNFNSIVNFLYNYAIKYNMINKDNEMEEKEKIAETIIRYINNLIFEEMRNDYKKNIYVIYNVYETEKENSIYILEDNANIVKNEKNCFYLLYRLGVRNKEWKNGDFANFWDNYNCYQIFDAPISIKIKFLFFNKKRYYTADLL